VCSFNRGASLRLATRKRDDDTVRQPLSQRFWPPNASYNARRDPTVTGLPVDRPSGAQAPVPAGLSPDVGFRVKIKESVHPWRSDLALIENEPD
jgi:hypothetical protein